MPYLSLSPFFQHIQEFCLDFSRQEVGAVDATTLEILSSLEKLTFLSLWNVHGRDIGSAPRAPGFSVLRELGVEGGSATGAHRILELVTSTSLGWLHLEDVLGIWREYRVGMELLSKFAPSLCELYWSSSQLLTAILVDVVGTVVPMSLIEPLLALQHLESLSVNLDGALRLARVPIPFTCKDSQRMGAAWQKLRYLSFDSQLFGFTVRSLATFAIHFPTVSHIGMQCILTWAPAGALEEIMAEIPVLPHGLKKPEACYILGQYSPLRLARILDRLFPDVTPDDDLPGDVKALLLELKDVRKEQMCRDRHQNIVSLCHSWTGPSTDVSSEAASLLLPTSRNEF